MPSAFGSEEVGARGGACALSTAGGAGRALGSAGARWSDASSSAIEGAWAVPGGAVAPARGVADGAWR